MSQSNDPAKKQPYSPKERHRFVAGEEGPAIDDKAERDRERTQRDQRETQERFQEQTKRLQESVREHNKKVHQEALNKYEHAQGNKSFWIGIGCVIFSIAYIADRGVAILPVVMIIIGVLLITVFWGAGLLNRDKQ